MRIWRMGFSGLGLLLVVLAVAACGGSTPVTSTTTSTEVLSPDQFSVESYAGKTLVVNFFGSWCGPCNSEAPALAEFAAANPEVQFVGIAVSDSEEKAVAFMEQYGLTYPLVVDDNSLSAAWNINGVPTTIFFTSAGQEADRIVGAAGLEQFEQSLDKAQ